MCNIEQCARCRLNSDTCGHYDHSDPSPCRGYVLPINNSVMFSRWYLFSGRIGRLEYALTLVISIVLYFFVVYGSGILVHLLGIKLESDLSFAILTFVDLIPTAYLMLAAGVKRTHDTRVSSWYSIIPVVMSVCLLAGIIPGLIPILFGIAGCVYLFKDAGEDGVNEHGSNPVQPYAEQISLDGVG